MNVGEHFPQEMRDEHDSKVSEAWMDLDPLQQSALNAWRRVKGQISILNPNVSKPEHIVMMLDSVAATWSLSAEGIPIHAQAAAWDVMQHAHEVAYHDGHGLGRICVAHACGDGPLADLECQRCRRALGISKVMTDG